MVEIDADSAFALLYGLVSLFSVTTFGYAGEWCDLRTSCPNRVRAIIAFAVFVFLLSALMFVAQLIGLAFVESLHLFITPVIFILNTVVAALAISPRTELRTSFTSPVEIAWWTEVLSVLLIFLAFADRSAPAKEKEGLEPHVPVSLQQSEDTVPPPMANA